MMKSHETISVRLQPEINPFFGDSPDGLVFLPTAGFCMLTNGNGQPLPVIRTWKKTNMQKALNPKSKVIGIYSYRRPILTYTAFRQISISNLDS